MATQVQIRRGTAAENDAFTGAAGELTYDTTNKRVRIHDGGTAGGFEIVTEDASGNINTGTVTADALDVNVDGNQTLNVNGTTRIYEGTTARFDLSATSSSTTFRTIGAYPQIFKTSDKERMQIANNGDISFYEDTGTTPKFFWDASAESLGIGTSSPSNKFVVSNGGAEGIELNVDQPDGANTVRYFNYNRSSATYQNTAYLAATHEWRIGNVERMRIDSSGNLLVGKSASGVANNGAELQSTGFTSITRDGGQPLQLNRKTSDGDIAVFKKDGTTVGAIGTSSSGDIQFADGNDLVRLKSGKVELRTSGGMGGIFVDDTVNSLWGGVDNTIDLGRSNYRYKDLYLSGGVYLGGTGSANHLDDYEEGTWTPTFGAGGTAPSVTYAYSYGYYVKIGSFVHVGIAISTTAFSGGSGTLTIDLPFTTTSSTNYRSSGYFAYNNMIVNPSSGGAPIVYVGQTNGYLLFYNCTTEGKSSTPLTPSNVSVSGTGYLQMFATFRTDS
jgi:hypothetical protein